MKLRNMNTYILLILLFTISIVQAQINHQDSSVQVITYWDVGEHYEYDVSLQKIKYTDTDTISNVMITYDVGITVIDSTEDSYIVCWDYKNFESNSKNKFEQKNSSFGSRYSCRY